MPHEQRGRPTQGSHHRSPGKLGDFDQRPRGSPRGGRKPRDLQARPAQTRHLELERWGGKTIDGYIEEAVAETPCGPEPNTARRALDPGPPVEAPLLGILAGRGTGFARDSADLEPPPREGPRGATGSHGAREAARDGGTRTAWPTAILNFREGGRPAERLHLLRRPVAGQTSDRWKTLCGASFIEARHGFRLPRDRTCLAGAGLRAVHEL